jgi:hypothetical protein
MFSNKGFALGGLLVVLGVLVLGSAAYLMVLRSPATPEPGPPGSSATIPSPIATKKCVPAGCSAERCVDEDTAALLRTACEFRPEYTCYKESFARCEVQSSGECGWTGTPELAACVADAKEPVRVTPSPTSQTKPPSAKPTPPPATPPPPTMTPPPVVTPPPSTPQTRTFEMRANDFNFTPPGPLMVPHHAQVQITFEIIEDGTYYGGLTFRSSKFEDVGGLPGETVTVNFVADESFTISSYWPASDVWKADLQIIVQ